MNTFCGKETLQGKELGDPKNAHLEESLRIESVTVGEELEISTAKRALFIVAHLLMRRLDLNLDDEGTNVSLTIVDTPGFGDQIDNEAR